MGSERISTYRRGAGRPGLRICHARGATGIAPTKWCSRSRLGIPRYSVFLDLRDPPCPWLSQSTSEDAGQNCRFYPRPCLLWYGHDHDDEDPPSDAKAETTTFCSRTRYLSGRVTTNYLFHLKARKARERLPQRLQRPGHTRHQVPIRTPPGVPAGRRDGCATDAFGS